MKKIFIAALLVASLPTMATTVENSMQSEEMVVSNSEAMSGVVFRSTQHLRSSDGRKIYLHPSGKCELFDGDRLEVECQYTIMGREVRLLDENGRTVYSGAFTYASDGRNISRLTLSGTTYYRF